jgi:hypothetical protein
MLFDWAAAVPDFATGSFVFFGLLLGWAGLGWAGLGWVELCSDWHRQRSFFTVISQHHRHALELKPVTTETEDGREGKGTQRYRRTLVALPVAE